MATPRRQPRPATDSEALRAKLATMTYSFAQQLPQLSSHTPPPPPHNPQTTAADDPNFPKLTSKPVYSQTNRTGQTLPRAWDAAKRLPTPGRPPRWANGSGKPATAAEVVASAPADISAQSEEVAESEKQEAELALYSKLVPTTSAVPRNPGSMLGGGGLRATGSVATQKTSRPSSGVGLHAPQPLPSLPRKEPMVSRMRSLSSDASKPQLARRVARLNRPASATPPPAPSVPSSASSNTSMDGMEIETAIHDELEKADIVSLPSMLKKDDVSHLRNVSREGSPLSASRQTLHSAVLRGQTEAHEPRVTSPPPRRLDEAFRSRNRTDNGTGTGISNGRKSSLTSSRRSSALSPPPGHRKSSGKDGHGRNGGWMSKEASETNVPPGFEGRSATQSRGTFTRSRNGRSESDSANSSRAFDRGNPPVRPQNARADALLEALNSRRRSSSPRTLRASRVTNGDVTSDTSGSDSMSTSYNGVRKRSEREILRSAKTEDDFNRRSQSSSSRDSVAGLSIPDISRQRRSTAGNSGRYRKPSERKGNFSSTGPRTQGMARFSSGGLEKEQRSNSKNHLTKSQQYAEKERSVNTTKKLSLYPSTNSRSHYLGQMRDESGEKVLPSVPRVQAQYPTSYQNGSSDPAYAHEQGNDWCGTVDEIGVNGGGRQPFMNNLFENGSDDTARFSHSSSLTKSDHNDQNASTSGMSMSDAMKFFHGNAAAPVTKNHVEGMDDVVLPPLPNSEDVAFESMLRSMGWTPLDEDEGPKNNQNHTARTGKLCDNDGTFHDGVPGQDVVHGTDNTENRKLGIGYYSHFQ